MVCGRSPGQLGAAPDTPDGSNWTKTWSAELGQVVYQNGVDNRVVLLLEEVAVQDVLDSAPMLVGSEWMKFWSPAAAKVHYCHCSTGQVLETFAEVAVAAAPNPPSDQWQKRWSDDSASVVYVETSPTLQATDKSYQEVCIAHAIAAAPDPGEGWSTVWDSVAGAPAYWNAETQQTVAHLADVTRLNVFASAADPGHGWTRGYDAEAESVFYVHLDSEARADSIEAVDAENGRLALEATPAPSGDGWTKRWSTERGRVDFVSNINGYVVDTATAADAIDASPTPSHPWGKFWSTDREVVVFRHGVTNKMVDSLAEVEIANQIAMAPDPPNSGWRDAVFGPPLPRTMPTWEKQWSAEMEAVFYQCVSGAIAWSIAEVDAEIQRAALAEAPDLAAPWTKGWSFAKMAVYYHNPTTGCRAWGPEETAQADAVEAAPCAGESWGRVWSEEWGAVAYEHVRTKVRARTLAETAKRDKLSAAPNVPEAFDFFWEKRWDEDKAAVVYRNRRSKIAVTDWAAIEAIEEAPVPGGLLISTFRKIWDAETRTVQYEEMESGNVFATTAEADVAMQLNASPDAPAGWLKVWSKKHATVMYRHETTRIRVRSVNAALCADAQNPEGAAAGEWEKVWNEAESTVEYRHAGSGRAVFSAEEAEMLSEVQAAAEAPRGWQKKWSKAKKTVRYKHRTRPNTVARDLEEIEALEDKWYPPICGWFKVWSEADTAMSAYEPTAEKRATSPGAVACVWGVDFETVMLFEAPDPGYPGWRKKWDGRLGMVIYVNGTARVYTVKEVAEKEREVQIAEAPEVPGWVNRWDTVKGMVVYDPHPRNRNRASCPSAVESAVDVMTIEDHIAPHMDGWDKAFLPKRGGTLYQKVGKPEVMFFTREEVLLHDAKDPIGWILGWQKYWDDAADKVMYRRTPAFLRGVKRGEGPRCTADGTPWADVALASIAELVRFDFLETAPVPPAGWKKQWDDENETGYYLNVSSDHRALSIDDIKSIASSRQQSAGPSYDDATKLELRVRGNIYDIDLGAMTQTNRSTGFARNIRAGALSWEFEDGPRGSGDWKRYDDFTSRKIDLTSSAGPGIGDPDPGFIQLWASTGKLGRDKERLFLVARGNPEHADISRQFFRTLGSATIVRIERVENGAIRAAFALQADTLAREMGAAHAAGRMKRRIVRRLFHGTQAVEAIVNSSSGHGFLPLLAGTAVGAIHGNGTYFARDASYSDSNGFARTDPQSSGQKQMLLVDVLVGRYEKGAPGMKMFSLIPGEQHIRYNSLVDKVADPSIFVVQHSNQAYPACKDR